MNIEVVVVGAMGDLARSMVPQLSGCHHQSTRMIVCGRRAVGDLTTGLVAAGVVIESVATLTVAPQEPPSPGEARLPGPVKHANAGRSPRARDE